MPPMGTMNLHASILPKYRGAAPINWAIINGEVETGLTTFLLKHEIDTGDMIFQQKMPIGPDETAGELHDRMMLIGASLVLQTVQAIQSGTYKLIPQDNTLVSKAPKIHHETCEIDFHMPSDQVYNFIRGLSPYPSAWTTIDSKKMKVFRACKVFPDTNKDPGYLETDQKDFIRIFTSDGAVELLEIQLEGRKKMSITDFLNGYQVMSSRVSNK
jgi:methionyl-tRNA formyltransferase